MPVRHPSARLSAALLCAGSLVLVGCSGAPKGNAAASGSHVTLFADGQYEQAYDSALEAAGKLRGPRHDEAALIAGLSAHALNRNSEAIRWLGPLEANANRDIAGKANATLGLIAQERSEHTIAAGRLARAAQFLGGDEAARAAMYAGDSYHAIGKTAEAQQAYKLAQARVANDGGLRMMIGDRLAGNIPSPGTSLTKAGTPTTTTGQTKPSAAGGYTVQAGAFSSEATAQREAQRLSDAMRGLESVRVVPITRNGKTLYAVHVGRYSTAAAAQTIRQGLGKQAIVASAAD